MSTANLDSADLKGVAYGGLINEDVMQQIWDISKIPLPLTDRIGTDRCRNSYKEWTTDELAAPNLANKVVDGSDASGNDTKTGARVGNHCQISTKVVRVSTRANESDTIGRSSELAYQVMRRQQELKRDVEAIMLSRQASVADDGNTTAGQSAGLASWLTTNDFRGGGGSAAGFSSGIVAAPVAGTARALTETMVRDCVQSVYQQGGDPTVMMSTPALIRKFSEYLFTSSARVATITADQGKSSSPATALGAVNVFVTDFGTLDLVPNRLQPLHDLATDTVDVFIIDPSYLSIGFLHGYRTEPLAKTGLADNRQMAVDWTLIVHTEKAHGVIADIDPTQAVTA
jgi:hypothetical protein